MNMQATIGLPVGVVTSLDITRSNILELSAPVGKDKRQMGETDWSCCSLNFPRLQYIAGGTIASH